MPGTVVHEIPPVWNSESRVLILGTMPSPKSRELGFFYMHPQNRFWRVLPAIFGESLSTQNNAPNRESAIQERKYFLLRHNLALWDVLSSCQINGASDSSITNAVANDFTQIFENSKITMYSAQEKPPTNSGKSSAQKITKKPSPSQAPASPAPAPQTPHGVLKDLWKSTQS